MEEVRLGGVGIGTRSHKPLLNRWFEKMPIWLRLLALALFVGCMCTWISVHEAGGCRRSSSSGGWRGAKTRSSAEMRRGRRRGGRNASGGW